MANLPDLEQEITRLGTLRRATPPATLLPRIVAGLARTPTLSPPEWRALAAAAVLLLTLNAAALVSYQSSLAQNETTDGWALLNTYETNN